MCEMLKLPETQSVSEKYGHIPIKEAEAEAEPWEKLCVDLIRPYTIKWKGSESL
jgi:hypothetical protein